MQHEEHPAKKGATSSSGIRVCLVCQTEYIMSFDLHARCESCLRLEYAGVALTPQAACPYCKVLPAAEMQRRADAFAATAEDVFPVLDLYPLDDALDFFHTGSESDDSAPPHDSPRGRVSLQASAAANNTMFSINKMAAEPELLPGRA